MKQLPSYFAQPLDRANNPLHFRSEMQFEEHRFHSSALGNERTLWVRAPAEEAPSASLPLLIFLDGEIYRQELDAEAALARLEEEESLSRSIAVFVSSIGPEERFAECPCNPGFADCILDELLPWIEERHSAAAGPEARTVLGVSYTGLAATWVGLEGAGRIGRVVSQSGSFWSNDGYLIDHLGERDLVPVSFYLEVGNEETQDYIEHRPDLVQMESQLLSNRRMRDALQRQGFPVHYREFSGTHHPNAWRTTLPDALRWALQSAAGTQAQDAGQHSGTV